MIATIAMPEVSMFKRLMCQMECCINIRPPSGYFARALFWGAGVTRFLQMVRYMTPSAADSVIPLNAGSGDPAYNLLRLEPVG